MSESDDERTLPPLQLEGRGGIYATLAGIEAGRVTLTMVTPHGAEEHPEYVASNGWRFRVFDDVGGWDYIEAFARPGGNWRGWPDELTPTHSLYDALMRYRPSNLDAWHWVRDGVSPGGYMH